jgi:hypothetical protein
MSVTVELENCKLLKTENCQKQRISKKQQTGKNSKLAKKQQIVKNSKFGLQL